jgi:hypothetical protein
MGPADHPTTSSCIARKQPLDDEQLEARNDRNDSRQLLSTAARRQTVEKSGTAAGRLEGSGTRFGHVAREWGGTRSGALEGPWASDGAFRSARRVVLGRFVESVSGPCQGTKAWIG